MESKGIRLDSGRQYWRTREKLWCILLHCKYSHLSSLSVARNCPDPTAWSDVSGLYLMDSRISCCFLTRQILHHFDQAGISFAGSNSKIETFRFVSMDDSEVFCPFSENSNPEKFYCTFLLEKLERLFLLKEFEPSPDRRMIKLLTFDNLFPPP